jgi:2-C-methyl-D-erythritol 4-phosphate cytidylyltransferase / 2-C-methyl-D-erythritol 2,4-cyclodiphosphate synthase
MTTKPLAPFARIHAIVPCAGVGVRAGAATPKQYAMLAGEPMVVHTLRALLAVQAIDHVMVVVSEGDDTLTKVMPTQPDPRVRIVPAGGPTRAASVRAGLVQALADGAHHEDWALVHDAARCLIEASSVQRLIDACQADAVGGLLAWPLSDTLKQAQDGRSATTLARADKWLAQTPQMFRIGALLQALTAAGDAVTDEASAMELAGHAPLLVQGDSANIKVTWPQDLAVAEQRIQGMKASPATTQDTLAMRIGEGWDIHALVEGRPLMLGGVLVPHTHGLLGHSDADALLHAITDALLGAAGLGDIGRHFPDTDAAHRGADSGGLLQVAAQRVRERGYTIVNVDGTIIAQAPKLSPYVERMRERIAALLSIPADCVNVKAKTAEKMGPVGAGQAMEARAVCLLQGSHHRTAGGTIATT